MNRKQVNFKNIPDELKKLDQWVLWKAMQKPGEKKLRKVPFSIAGYEAKVSDPSTWGSFKKVMDIYHNSFVYGIGFVFSDNDPYCGIDFDIMNNGVIDWINKFSSYTEYSQSGKGVHIIVKGKKPGDRCKNPKKNYEIYDSDRYFVFTGNLYHPKLNTVGERQKEIKTKLRNTMKII